MEKNPRLQVRVHAAGIWVYIASVGPPKPQASFKAALMKWKVGKLDQGEGTASQDGHTVPWTPMSSTSTAVTFLP